MKTVIDVIKEIPQQGQVQYDLARQLRELRMAANKLGLYDAADFLRPKEADPDMNTDAWIVPPKGDDQKYWLNKYGKRIWQRNFKDTSNQIQYTLTAERSYYWCDRVIVTDENRKVLNDLKFSDFIAHPLYDQWIPVQPEITEHVNDDKPSI
jgi:hypothetical protein